MQCKVLPVPGISYIPAALLSYIRSFWNSLAQCRSRSSSLRRKRCLRKLFMNLEHFFVHFRICIVVIPVHHSKIRIWFFPSTAVCIFRYFIVSAACVGCDVHIAPHHWFQVKFFTDCQYSVTVFPDQRGTLFVSVFLQIISQSKLHCLIHSQMNAVSMKSFFYRFQHPFDELIGFFFSYLKDVGSVFDLLPARPFQGIVEMGQSLDTGNQFYSEFLRIIIHFTDFRCAVSASVSSEIRFVFYLVSVLCVKHQHIHSHACQDADHGFHFLHSEDAVAGAVQHQTVSWEIRSFPFFICFLIQIVQTVTTPTDWAFLPSW